MIVYIPSPLRSYTQNLSEIQAEGSTIAELLNNIDHSHPGFRFRIIDEQDAIREHIKIFRNQEQATDLHMTLAASDVVHIIAALSGG